jgi:hypothetical protein
MQWFVEPLDRLIWLCNAALVLVLILLKVYHYMTQRQQLQFLLQQKLQ